MLQVTPGSEFRKGREKGEVITLPPTGRVVRVRAVKPSHLLKLGEIPDVLSTLVVKLLYGQISEAEYRDFFTETEKRERALEMAESLRIVCTAALLEPRIVENPEADDEISIDDLEDSEQRIIFDLAMLEASALTRFRERQEELVGAMDGLEDDEFQTEPVGVSQG